MASGDPTDTPAVTEGGAASPAPSPSRPSPSQPIGVFDSGVGGLTVVAALRRELPHESILYLGDTARLPYGTKSADTVTRYTQRNVEVLVERGVKAVVIACNTASALAMPRLEEPVPVWEVIEPGARRAAAASRGRVGVIATESTIQSGAYVDALRRARPELEVFPRSCPLFVPLVEEGWSDDPVAEEIARRYLEPLLERGIDTLVLACTHYPLLTPVLARVVGPEVTLVDSAAAVAGTLAEDLRSRGLAAPPSAPATLHALVTDTAERFGRIAHEILGEEVPFELVDVT